MQDRLSTQPHGIYTQDTHYPTHHPKAGTLNPQANQFDIDKAVDKLYPEWSRRVHLKLMRNPQHARVATHHRERHGGVEHGMSLDDDDRSSESEDETSSEEVDALANAISQLNDIDGELARAVQQALSTQPIGPDDICGACGGRGHFSTVGNKKCLTLVLKNVISRDELAQTQYPRGLKFPVFKKGAKARFSDKGESSSQVREDDRKSPRRYKKPFRKGSKSPGRKDSKKPFRGSRSRASAVVKNEDKSSGSNSSESEGSSSEADVEHHGKLAVEYTHIITPPPSPPSSPTPEKDRCHDSEP